MATEKSLSVELRVRTWVERDQKGWYCVVGFWHGDPNPDAPEDDSFRVGPWGTEAEARFELTGKFRDIVTQATAAYVEAKGGFIRDGRSQIPTAS